MPFTKIKTPKLFCFSSKSAPTRTEKHRPAAVRHTAAASRHVPHSLLRGCWPKRPAKRPHGASSSACTEDSVRLYRLNSASSTFSPETFKKRRSFVTSEKLVSTLKRDS